MGLIWILASTCSIWHLIPCLEEVSAVPTGPFDCKGSDKIGVWPFPCCSRCCVAPLGKAVYDFLYLGVLWVQGGCWGVHWRAGEWLYHKMRGWSFKVKHCELLPKPRVTSGQEQSRAQAVAARPGFHLETSMEGEWETFLKCNHIKHQFCGGSRCDLILLRAVPELSWGGTGQEKTLSCIPHPSAVPPSHAT